MKCFICLLFLSFECAGLFAQHWPLRIPTSSDDVLYSAIETGSGHFILCGARYWMFQNNDTTAYLLETDQYGNVMQEKTWIQPYHSVWYSDIKETSGGYLLFGSVRETDSSDTQLFIQKLDDAFNSQWMRIYGDHNASGDCFNKVLKTTNNRYLAIGYAYSHTDSTGTADFMAILFNEYGDSLQGIVQPYPGLVMGFDALELHPNQYRIFIWTVPGFGSSNSGGFFDLDTSLNILDTSRFDTLNYPNQNLDGGRISWSLSVKMLAPDIYACSGNIEIDTNAFTNNIEDMGMALFDTSNSIISTFSYGKPDTLEFVTYRNSLDFIDTGNIYISGVSNADYSYLFMDNRDTWIALYKVNTAGNILWKKYFGGDKYYYMWDMLATQDSGCLLVASVYSLPEDSLKRDIYLIKVDQNGNVSTKRNNTADPGNPFTLYPNPATSSFTVAGSYALPATLRLYDLTGRQVLSAELHSGRQRVNVGQLSQGMYLLRLSSPDGTATCKLLLH